MNENRGIQTVLPVLNSSLLPFFQDGAQIIQNQMHRIVSVYAIRLMPCNQPDLILLNKFGMLASSKGRVPHSSAYRITPIDHTSTSAPAYRLPHITCCVKDMRVQAFDYSQSAVLCVVMNHHHLIFTTYNIEYPIQVSSIFLQHLQSEMSFK